MENSEYQKYLPDGQYWDRLTRGNGEYVDFGWRSNIVVDRCRVLLAAFMKGDAVSGIQHISLGIGDSSWDDLPYEAPVASTFELIDPAPIQILVSGSEMTIDFIDVAGNITLDASNNIVVTTTIEGNNLGLAPNETFELREFALFGEFDGTAYMIDYVRHPVINIGIDDSLARSVRLVF